VFLSVLHKELSAAPANTCSVYTHMKNVGEVAVHIRRSSKCQTRSDIFMCTIYVLAFCRVTADRFTGLVTGKDAYDMNVYAEICVCPNFTPYNTPTSVRFE